MLGGAVKCSAYLKIEAMKVIQSYEKVGKCQRLSENSVLGKYCFLGEYADDGSLIYKDEENFVKRWDEPCYVPTSEFGEESNGYTITDKYETHKTLLELCHYNEKLCKCMFGLLSWQSPTVWLDALDAEDYAEAYDFVQVGRKAFWNEPLSERVQMGFYEVVKIEDKSENWSWSTPVVLKVQDCSGEYWNVEAYLGELSETDVKLKLRKMKNG